MGMTEEAGERGRRRRHFRPEPQIMRLDRLATGGITGDW
jgi:hypothetical protein